MSARTKRFVRREAVEKKIRKAVKSRKLNKKSKTLLDDALKANLITQEEFHLIAEAERLRLDAVQVDDYSPEEYLPGGLPKGSPTATPSEAVAFQRR